MVGDRVGEGNLGIVELAQLAGTDHHHAHEAGAHRQPDRHGRLQQRPPAGAQARTGDGGAAVGRALHELEGLDRRCPQAPVLVPAQAVGVGQAELPGILGAQPEGTGLGVGRLHDGGQTGLGHLAQLDRAVHGRRHRHHGLHQVALVAAALVHGVHVAAGQLHDHGRLHPLQALDADQDRVLGGALAAGSALEGTREVGANDRDGLQQRVEWDPDLRAGAAHLADHRSDARQEVAIAQALEHQAEGAGDQR